MKGCPHRKHIYGNTSKLDEGYQQPKVVFDDFQFERKEFKDWVTNRKNMKTVYLRSSVEGVS